MTITRPQPTEATLQFTSGSVQVAPEQLTVGDPSRAGGAEAGYTIQFPGEYDVRGIAFDVGRGYAVLHADGQRILVIQPEHPPLASETMTAHEGIELVVTWAEATPEQNRALASTIADLEPRGVVVFGTPDEAKTLTGQTVEPIEKLKLQSTDLAGEELRVWAIA